MTGFAHQRPATIDEALAALAGEGAMPVGGGTDLLTWIDEGLAAPGLLVDVRAWPGADAIEVGGDGGARIGAAALIAELAAHAGLRARFPALADACASVGSPALRNMGTIGGNLAQRPRCWYLRRNVRCFKNGGTGCPAVGGEHQYHGIVADGTCRAVHPSDPAVALAALGASVEVRGRDGSVRLITVDALYAGAAANPGSELVIAHGELITAIVIPAAAGGGAQSWEKVIQRGAWDFALVSCAAARHADGTVRIALGGVALGPMRIAESVEEDVASGGLDDESFDALAERAMYDAEPLPGTAYKVEIAKGMLRRAMRELGR